MISNYHTHTSRCHHAVGRDEEYVLAAIDSGLQILGFSDHTPFHFPDGYVSRVRMLPDELMVYADSVRSLGRAYGDQIQIHLGLETEYYPALFDDAVQMARDAGVEYMILGQHWNGNEAGVVSNGTPSDDEGKLRQYCYQICKGMETGLFTYLAHPDLIDFTGDSKIYDRHMRALCREAKGYGVPLEINLLGIRQQRIYPAEAFWRIAAEENCPVVMGSDAHDPKHIVDVPSQQVALDMISRLGLKLLTTPELKKL